MANASLEPLAAHRALGTSLTGPYPEGHERLVIGMGCFWGAERLFWRQPGSHVTAVGYAGGATAAPTYRETCTGRSGHAEAVLAVFDPTVTSYEGLLRVFWEGHDPTQGLRQGNDVGSQYRSAIFWHDERQRDLALASRDAYQERLARSGFGPITTEIAEAGHFTFAEPYHQQYLVTHPNGYCGLEGTGVACPAGLVSA
ncbi:MAG: peptide-methionine (S)-S-oxide reductase MsrA [Thermoleophilia bacterium]|nr:peptide-methionine (S)-S-oxide reductase MsrA [Thermoleophilia bacterium]